MKMKVVIIQQQNGAYREENRRRLREKILKLGREGAELVVLQELHEGLYFCQVESVDRFDEAETIPGPSTQFYGKVAKEAGVVLVLSLIHI